MKLKKGVSLSGIKPEMIAAMLVIEPILSGYDQELIITSGREGAHSKNSKHYLGYAVDVRNWQLEKDGTTEAAVVLLQNELHDEYYVKNSQTHIHIQYNGLQIG